MKSYPIRPLLNKIKELGKNVSKALIGLKSRYKKQTTVITEESKEMKLEDELEWLNKVISSLEQEAKYLKVKVNKCVSLEQISKLENILAIRKRSYKAINEKTNKLKQQERKLIALYKIPEPDYNNEVII